MKRIYIEDLNPTSKGVVSWNNSVGKDVRFEYNDIHDSIKIIDYDSNNKCPRIKVLYKDKEKWISVGSFKQCHIGNIIGTSNIDYVFNVNDIAFEQFVILEQIKIKRSKKSHSYLKGYKCKCMKCGCIFEIKETSLVIYKNCPCCCRNPKKLFVGYNDLYTKRPDIAKLLLYPNEAKNYIYNSTAKTNWRCPICGEIIYNKQIDYVIYKGLKCIRCSDKHFSYPERVLFELLKMLNTNFEFHKKFVWSNNKEYDFYLIDYNCIIETHGLQHYEESHGSWSNSRTLKSEQENDKLKEQMAKDNGFNYIIIDCRQSDFEFIYNNIITSDLIVLFDLYKIDKFILQENTYSSYVKIIADLWNSGICTIKELQEQLHMSKFLIRQYLKQAASVNICDYNSKSMIEYKIKNNLITTASSKAVECVTHKKQFKSFSEASKYYNISVQTISRVCKNNTSKNVNGELLNFKLIDKYD